MAVDNRINTEEVIKELVQIAGRPAEEPPSEKMAEEDDCECTQNNKMHVVMFVTWTTEEELCSIYNSGEIGVK